jgi:hypothetical protein
MESLITMIFFLSSFCSHQLCLAAAYQKVYPKVTASEWGDQEWDVDTLTWLNLRRFSHASMNRHPLEWFRTIEPGPLTLAKVMLKQRLASLAGKSIEAKMYLLEPCCMNIVLLKPV